MTDSQLQQKLNQLVKLCNELQDEAESRYGDQGSLFFEAGGTFHIMDGDEHEDHAGIEARQNHIRHSSDGYCRLGAGAW